MKRKMTWPLPMLYCLTIGCFLLFVQWGSRATSVIAQKIPLERDHTIILDAGHGGEDGGATSCAGILESEYNLQIALKLQDLLHLMGYKTKMVRTTDISIYTSGESIAAKKISDLRQRVKLVNETENGILISIHQNTFSDSRYRGAQVFYGKKGESAELARSLQQEFCKSLNPGSNRKSKRAEGIYLMEHIECTGVLVECGFLSNLEEEAFLRDDIYQRKLCCVIGSTLGKFLYGAD